MLVQQIKANEIEFRFKRNHFVEILFQKFNCSQEILA